MFEHAKCLVYRTSFYGCGGCIVYTVCLDLVVCFFSHHHHNEKIIHFNGIFALHPTDNGMYLPIYLYIILMRIGYLFSFFWITSRFTTILYTKATNSVRRWKTKRINAEDDGIIIINITRIPIYIATSLGIACINSARKKPPSLYFTTCRISTPVTIIIYYINYVDLYKYIYYIGILAVLLDFT